MSRLYELMVGHIIGTTTRQLRLVLPNTPFDRTMPGMMRYGGRREAGDKEKVNEKRGRNQGEEGGDIPSDNPSSNPAKNHSAS